MGLAAESLGSLGDCRACLVASDMTEMITPMTIAFYHKDIYLSALLCISRCHICQYWCFLLCGFWFDDVVNVVLLSTRYYLIVQTMIQMMCAILSVEPNDENDEIRCNFGVLVHASMHEWVGASRPSGERRFWRMFLKKCPNFGGGINSILKCWLESCAQPDASSKTDAGDQTENEQNRIDRRIVSVKG